MLTNGAAAALDGGTTWSDGPISRQLVDAIARPDGAGAQPNGAAPRTDGACPADRRRCPADRRRCPADRRAPPPRTDGAARAARTRSTRIRWSRHTPSPIDEPGPGVVGTATRADGKGLPTVVVTVADPTGRQEARTTTDRDGRYAVALPGPGTYLVVAAAGAYQPHAALVIVGADATTRHDVILAGTSGVHGLVRHGGDAVAGAAVTLIDAQGDVAAVGVTDGTGHYRLAGVPDGAYTLTATSAGHQPSAVSLWLDVGITVERNLDLPQRSRLAARSRRRAPAVRSKRRRRRSWTRAGWSSGARSRTRTARSPSPTCPQARTRSRRAATPRRRRPCT